MKKWVMAALLAWPAAGAAQTSPATTVDTAGQLMQWVQSQQANSGLALDWRGVKYVTTSWDVLSIGQSGLNVAKGGPADDLDLGPLVSAANAEKTRYGGLPLLHVGNIWNTASTRIPASVKAHVNTTALPDVSCGLGFFEPTDGVLKHWTWKKDTQFVLVYRYGGTP